MAAMTPRVSLVIVNYNAGARLEACLRSAGAALEGIDWEAVVVDNASSDGSDVFARDAGPRVRLLPQAENIGFGAGVNAGVATARAALLLVLNPDTVLRTGSFEALEDALARTDGAAVAGPRILDADGTVQGSARRDPSLWSGIVGRTTVVTRRLPWLARRIGDVVPPVESDAPRVIEVDWVSGAAFLARRDAFEAVGGFDPAFFLYWEDADLCRRLRARGWRIIYVTGAVVEHVVGVSSRTAPALAVRAFHDSAYRYYARWCAPSPYSVRRPMARAMLRARAWWKLRG